jgi:hypothetical protein
MNFRVTLAVACAAAVSFACADKQAVIPELEEAMKAPPGMKVVGLYKMTVTPVETASGIQAAFEVIPIGRDGNPNTNPINTVQVAGNFGAVTTTGPGGCNGVSALTAAVRITNFTIDPLRNVWADVIDMSGNTANTACNSSSPLVSETFFAFSDTSQGIWKYNDLAAAPGTGAAGGTSLPISAGGVWGFRYVTLTPFQFYFRIVADDQSPVLVNSSPNGPTNPLTWTSAVAASTNLEICPVEPPIAKGSACPAALLVNQPVAGAGVGPWSYSYAPAGLTPGATYWWRARNVYAAGASSFESDWFFFTFNGALPAVANKTWPANFPAGLGNVALLTWTTIAAQTDTWAILCVGPCPATRPAGANPAVLFDGAVQWDLFPLGDGLSHYELDATALLLTDATTGTYYDPAVTYDFRVYDYDGFSPPPLFSNPNFSSGTITITPVALAPVIASPGTQTTPVAYTLAGTAPWTVTWTTAAPTISVVYELLDLNDPLGFPFITSAVVPGVLNGTSGLYDYTEDLRPLVTPFGAGNYLMTVYNADLAGVYGSTHFFDVTP